MLFFSTFRAMKRIVTLIFLFGFTLLVNAQAKKAPAKAGAKPAATPTVAAIDSAQFKEQDPPAPADFAVYTIRYKYKKPGMKLCLNLVSNGNKMNYSYADSLVRDPEKTKVLFQQTEGDSVYTLVYVAAFTKDPDLPQCSAGKEVKLFFVRWSTKDGKGIVKQKYVESCYKTITRLGDLVIEDWAGTEPLKVTYNRGTYFYDVTFDPANFKMGLQSTKE